MSLKKKVIRRAHAEAAELGLILVPCQGQRGHYKLMAPANDDPTQTRFWTPYFQTTIWGIMDQLEHRREEQQ